MFGVLKMSILWYFVVHMFSSRNHVYLVLQMSNIFSKGENLVSTFPTLAMVRI